MAALAECIGGCDSLELTAIHQLNTDIEVSDDQELHLMAETELTP